MSTSEVILRITVATFLIVYLFYRNRQRIHRFFGLEPGRDFTGHGLEAERLLPRIREVRANCEKARCIPRPRTSAHLMTAIRRAIRRLNFFSTHVSAHPQHPTP